MLVTYLSKNPFKGDGWIMLRKTWTRNVAALWLPNLLCGILGVFGAIGVTIRVQVLGLLLWFLLGLLQRLL